MLFRSDDAKTFLVDSGYNPMFGARPLKRAIQSHLENPLAMEILEGKFLEGSIIDVATDAGKLTFSDRTK